MFGASYGWFVALLNVFILQYIVPVFAYYFSLNMVFGVSLRGYFFYAVFPFFLSDLNKNWYFKLAVLLLLGECLFLFFI